MTAAKPRTVEDVDTELTRLVKARSSSTATIKQLSGQIVMATRRIDQLLAERSELTDPKPVCPPTAAELMVEPCPVSKAP